MCPKPGQLAEPLTAAIFGYGQFNAGDVHMTCYAVMAYALGLIGFSLAKVLAPGDFARQDPRTQVRGAMLRLVADRGVDVFLFDWYAYEDGFFLDGALDRGFLAAPNRDRMKFALMWANHDWTDIHPARRGVRPARLYPVAVTPARFHEIADHVITRYFPHPDYWRVEGRPYFSIYDLNQFLASS